MSREPGSRIEGYRVLERVGQGSFGVTYRVRDEKLGLVFALKEYDPQAWCERSPEGGVRPRPGQEERFRRGLDRFLDEGRTLAGLKHPNIARVVRHFEADGTACLLMEYYAGRTLHELLVRDGPFDAGELQALLTPLLDALDTLGKRGVVHGDIKPSNILVQRDGTPVLLDFGAARVASTAAGAGPASAGSAGYAAIEQTRGRGEMGAWTDVYGLAATVYRLVSGEIPVPSEDRWDAVTAGRKDPLAPLGKRLGGGAGFHRGFGAAVDRGLALRTEDRPPGAAAWGDLLMPVQAAGHPRPKARRPGRRERVVLPQVLAAVLLLALLVAAGWVFLERSPEPGSPAPVTALPDTSLAEDEDSWEQAVRADTAAGFRAYLEAFPAGRHAEAAREQLALFDEQRWRALRDARDPAAFEDYLEAFPDGRYVVEARARAEVLREAEARARAEQDAERRRDDAAFAVARADGTDDALDEYLSRFPGGANVAEALELKAALARDERDRAAWRAARSSDEKAAYEAYLRAFPEGLHLPEALAAVERLTLRPGKRFRDCAGCPELVVLAPGNFDQGAEPGTPGVRSNEQPRHPVRLARPFAIGVHEVTFGEWDVCVRAGACRAQPVDNDWGRGSRPVIMVSWVDALDYVGWLSERTGEVYDLPSESQWEYAARAGEAGAWVGGAPARVCDFANVAGEETGFDWRLSACRDPFSVGTAPVGYFPANAMGVHDMVGNVAEWTRDCVNLSYLDAPADGSAWERGLCSSRVTRGGSWFSGSAAIRLPARFPLRTGERNDFTGFRVVRAVRE